MQEAPSAGPADMLRPIPQAASDFFEPASLLFWGAAPPRNVRPLNPRARAHTAPPPTKPTLSPTSKQTMALRAHASRATAAARRPAAAAAAAAAAASVARSRARASAVKPVASLASGNFDSATIKVRRMARGALRRLCAMPRACEARNQRGCRPLSERHSLSLSLSRSAERRTRARPPQVRARNWMGRVSPLPTRRACTHGCSRARAPRQRELAKTRFRLRRRRFQTCAPHISRSLQPALPSKSPAPPLPPPENTPPPRSSASAAAAPTPSTACSPPTSRACSFTSSTPTRRRWPRRRSSRGGGCRSAAS